LSVQSEVKKGLNAIFMISYHLDGISQGQSDRKDISMNRKLQERWKHTRYRFTLLGIVAPDEEDHVPLGSIDVVVL
jgi:hypothetical protein